MKMITEMFIYGDDTRKKEILVSLLTDLLIDCELLYNNGRALSAVEFKAESFAEYLYDKIGVWDIEEGIVKAFKIHIDRSNRMPTVADIIGILRDIRPGPRPVWDKPAQGKITPGYGRKVVEDFLRKQGKLIEEEK